MNRVILNKNMDWFTNARFGMFIHWGLYSITARDIWYYSKEEVPKEKYELLFHRFNPVDFDPNEWAKLAKESGMKYAIITAKHHDGFCLFDSEYTNFKITNTRYGRDIIGPWVEAFRASGLKIGLYYSLIDWHHPHFTIDQKHPQRNNTEAKKEERHWEKYVRFLHAQIEELLTKYGNIDIFWPDYSYDGKGKDEWRSREIISIVHKINPNTIINDRLGITGDFITPEQYIPRSSPKGVWESCITIGQSWGYYRQDQKNKSTKQLIRILTDVVSKNGNLLLNVGPTPKGKIQDEFVTNLKEIGKWMDENGESIYCCGRSHFSSPSDTRYTQRKEYLYLHVYDVIPGWLALSGLGGKVEHATFVKDGSDVETKEKNSDLRISIPEKNLNPYDTVICLRLRH